MRNKPLQVLLVVEVGLLLFQVGLLAGLIPFEYTWGGRLEGDNQMYAFVSVAVFLHLILILALLVKGNYLRIHISGVLINRVLWFFLGIFVLNTIGNLMAKTSVEKSFALLALLLAVLLWRVLRKGR